MKVFVGRDGRAPALTGVGGLRWDQPTAPRFTMTVLDDSGGEGLRILSDDYKVSNPRVDGLVLEVVDHQGIEWNCGWIDPKLDITSRTPVITGAIEKISAFVVDLPLTLHPASSCIWTQLLVFPLKSGARRPSRLAVKWSP